MMTSTKSKRDQSVQEMLTRSHPSQSKHADAPAQTQGLADKGDAEDDGAAPVTKGFLTSLFNSQRTDLQELRRDFSQEMRELRADLTSLGERESGMADNEISRGDKVEQLQQEIICLRERQQQLQIAPRIWKIIPVATIYALGGLLMGLKGTTSKSMLRLCFALSWAQRVSRRSYWTGSTEQADYRELGRALPTS
ncbi:hypothetical protein NDU88_003761 [Pleurodeles waltl]|uniref:Uncharacterized protein n=1 Tax=Pleurodeles waltl TaxID=8319 RepID=A0AAV7NKB0_PLEWA|nr:hypothetical protein NDU88_003761 [Pleurodeles waltl]